MALINQTQLMEIESKNVYVTPIRISREFMFLINKFRARCMLEGKKVPTVPTITKKIAILITEDELWNEFY